LINRHDPENKPPLARVRRIAAPPFEPNLADLAALSDEAETHRLVRQAGGRSSPIVLKWQENAAAIRARNGHEFTLREMLETLSKSERSTYWFSKRGAPSGSRFYSSPFDGEIEFAED
jgi:hypothetical protein